MEEKIYNVLIDILQELKQLNKNKKNKKRILSDDEKIDLFVDYIVNFKYPDLSKADLRASKIVSSDNFKHFIDYNIDEIIRRTKEKYNIFLSRCVKGCYLYKKPYNVKKT